jgi:hypothetical protein
MTRKKAEPEPIAGAVEEVVNVAQEKRNEKWANAFNNITDKHAGVKFHWDYKRHTGIITFDEKPSAELLEKVRPIMVEAGFYWNAELVAREKRIRFETRADERTIAKRAFFEVADTIREFKGLSASAFDPGMDEAISR